MSLDKFKIEKRAMSVIEQLDPSAKCQVNVTDRDCSISIETESSGILIGRHGETLEALQHLLRAMVSKDSEEFVPLMLDISGYRANRETEIKEMAKVIAEKVLNFGGTESLPPMNAYERRLAHLVLQDFTNIESESVGIEPDRRIVIKPKKA